MEQPLGRRLVAEYLGILLLAALVAGLWAAYSNGSAEANMNRLKLIKRARGIRSLALIRPPCMDRSVTQVLA